MSDIFQTISPIDGTVLFSRRYATTSQIDQCLAQSHQAQQQWKKVPLVERVALVEQFVQKFASQADSHAEEICRQMGRPIRYCRGEINGFVQRANTMLELAPSSLQDIRPGTKKGFQRFIRREPLGVVLCWRHGIIHI